MNKNSLNLKNLNHVRFNCSNLTEIICRENPTFVFVNKRSLNRNCGVQIVSVFTRFCINELLRKLPSRLDYV